MTEPTTPPEKPPREKLEALGIEAFCEMVVEGKSLRTIAKELGMSTFPIVYWITRDPERKKLYDAARMAYAEALVTEIIEMADEEMPANPTTGGTDTGAVQDKRVRLDTRKWIASKILPAYGDKLNLDATMRTELTPEQAKLRATALLKRLQAHGVLATTAIATDAVTEQPRRADT